MTRQRVLKRIMGGCGLFVGGLWSIHASATVIVVKTKQTTGAELRRHFASASQPHTWSGTEVGNGIRFVDRAFFGATWDDTTSFPGDHYFVVGVAPGVDVEKTLDDIRGLPDVVSADFDVELSDPVAPIVAPARPPGPNDPHLRDQWYLSSLQVFDAWNLTTGENTWVADVESGFDIGHPDLIHQFDLARSNDYDPDAGDPTDIAHGIRNHGTPVAGIIAAEADNGQFMAGIAYHARLIGSQMADSYAAHVSEPIWTVNAAKAILGSIHEKASVILIEKQVPRLASSIERIDVIYDAIKAAVDAGIPVVVPAGNFGNALEAEAARPDTGSIFVGASTMAEEPSEFSNYGERVTVVAPGEKIYTIQENNGEIDNFGGTSSASAIVAGIVALVRSVNPKLLPREIRNLLIETGKPLSGFDKPMSAVLPLAALIPIAPKRITGPLVQAGPAVRRAVR